MGAYLKAEPTTLLVKHSEFSELVGLIEDSYVLSKLGLTPNNLSGIFRNEDLSDLFDFCQSNPAYHIISYVGPGRYVNKYVKNTNSYGLANGSKDPSIILNMTLDPEMPLILEDAICETLAILDYIKNRN